MCGWGILVLGWGKDGILGSVRVFEKGLDSTVWILAHGGWTCQIRCMVFFCSEQDSKAGMVFNCRKKGMGTETKSRKRKKDTRSS